MPTDPETVIEYVLSKHVSEYMTRDVLILNENTMTSEATGLLQRYEADEIIVTNDSKKAVGIVTDGDILKKVADTTVYAETTKLKDIMSSPLVTVNEKVSLKETLQIMKIHHIRKLPVLSKDTVIGIITQATIANAIRTSAMTEARLLSPPFRAILGNLGFVLQFAGVLIMVPAVLATLLNETVIASGIYLSALLLLITGFFLNSYGEKAPLNLRQSSILVFASLFLLILFGTIPYLYVAPYNTGSEFDLFANSFFSSASGFTTGGISLFDKPEDLPQSFTFYRSYTQLVGGMSFIYLVLTAFYPERKLRSMRGFISGKTLHLKELFSTITIIFFVYITIIALLLYYFGEENLIDDFSLAMTTVSTGGLLPNSQILVDLVWQEYVILIVAMILGALPFTFHYAYIRKQTIPPKFWKEIIVFLIVLSIGVVLFSITSGFELLDSIFYATSASSTAGLQTESLNGLNGISKTILILLMLVGGCGFSTAGGIKVYRILLARLFVKGFNKQIRDKFSPSMKNDIKSTMIVLGAFPLIALLTSLYFVSTGSEFGVAFFDATALITTGGLSAGSITLDTEPVAKIAFAFLMMFGRLEIIGIVYIFTKKFNDS